MKIVTRPGDLRSLFLVCVAWSVLGIAPRAPAAEELVVKEMKIEGRVAKDVRVTEATPTHVTVSWEGNMRKLERQNLPPELQSRYPYDARAAAEYQREQDAERARKADQEKVRQDKRSRELKTSLQQQKRTVTDRVAELEKETLRLDADIKLLERKAKGAPAGSNARRRLNLALEERLGLRHRLQAQQDLLANIKKQLDSLP